MIPGRELDVLVAEKVMGWKWPEGRCPVCGWPYADSQERGCLPGGCSQRPRPLIPASINYPRYSTRIEDAWKVMEWIWEQDESANAYLNKLDGQYFIEEHRERLGEHSVREIAYADSAPHTICLAALKVAGVEDQP